MQVSDSHPLLLANLNAKAQQSSDAFLGASVGFVSGYGTHGAKSRPFRQDLAVYRFSDWVYAASLLNAQQIASTPLRLYVRKRAGKSPLYRTRAVGRRAKGYLTGDRQHRPSPTVIAKLAEFGDDFEEVTEPHPALKVLSSVNDWMNGFELATLRFVFLQLTGNAYITTVIDPATGIPSELWLMPSQWMRVIPGLPEDNVLLKGWFYGRPGSEREFAADEVIQWRLPNIGGQQSDNDMLYYGKGKAEAAWSAMNLHDAKRLQDQARFDNFSRPDWMIGVEGASAAALQTLEAAIEQRHRGVRNTGKILATNGKVTAQALNLPDPEVGDSDKVVQEIAAIFGVPLYKLLGNDPVKSNSEIQDTGWLRDTILPYLRLDEEQLNAKYLPQFGIEDDAVLAYDNPVPENETIEADRRTKYVAGGIMASNEARAEIGMEPKDGGDVLLVPSTSVPITMAGQQAASPLAGLFASAPAVSAPTTPTAPATQPTPPAATLTGEMIDLALNVVSQVTAGTLPRDSGLAIMESAGIPKDKAAGIMAGAGTPKPTTPNPVATPTGETVAGGDASGGTVSLNGAQITALAGVLDGLQAGRLVGPVAVEMIAALGIPRETATTMVADTEKAKKPGEPAPVAPPEPAKAKTARVVKVAYASPPPDGMEMVPLLRDIFAQQAAEVLGNVSKSIVTKDDDREDGDKPAKPVKPSKVSPMPMVDLSAWDATLAAAVQPVMEKVARVGVEAMKRVLTDAGVKEEVFRVVDANLPKAVEDLSLKFAQSTNATTSQELNTAAEKLRGEIEQGIVSGDTVDEMKARVQTVFDRATDSRAETIARTEATRARHSAEQMTARESGVVKTKAWLASADACPLCDEMAAKGSIPLDDSFTADSYGDVDSPPRHPNCTCSVTYGLTDE